MNFISKFIGGFINILNDIFLYRYLLSTTSKNLFIHSKLIFSVYHKYLKNKKYYKDQFINFNELNNKKKSDKLFIFGSGTSINEINENEWKFIKDYDTCGFNGTFHLNKVNIDFHILRAGSEDPKIEDKNKLGDEIKYARYLVEKVSNNKFYKNTTFLFSYGLSQHFPNLLIGYKLWGDKNSIFQFNTNKISFYPSKNIYYGLHHRIGTLIDAISFGYYMGYKEIILVGVDLYDNGYFWAEKNKTIKFSREHGKEINSDKTIRGLNVLEKHNTVNNGIINFLDKWKLYFEKKKVKVFILNPKSLLNKTLPVYKIR